MKQCKRCGGAEGPDRMFLPHGMVCLPCHAAARDARIAKRKKAAVEYAKRIGYKYQKEYQKEYQKKCRTMRAEAGVRCWRDREDCGRDTRREC